MIYDFPRILLMEIYGLYDFVNLSDYVAQSRRQMFCKENFRKNKIRDDIIDTEIAISKYLRGRQGFFLRTGICVDVQGREITLDFDGCEFPSNPNTILG